LWLDQTFFGKAHQLLARRLARGAEPLAQSSGGEAALHLERHQHPLGRIAGRPGRIFQGRT